MGESERGRGDDGAVRAEQRLQRGGEREGHQADQDCPGVTASTGVRLDITEIRVKLTDDPRNKLKAYCSVTIDDAFVVRDLKIIEGSKGPFVAMPSRKLADHCPRCGHKNHLRACYCNQCGSGLDPDRAPRDDRGRARLHADLAHPINSQTRIELHKAVVRAYAEEVDAAQTAGANYRPKSFDDFDYLADGVDVEYLEELERRQEERDRRRRLAASLEEDGDPRVAPAKASAAGADGERPGRSADGHAGEAASG